MNILQVIVAKKKLVLPLLLLATGLLFSLNAPGFITVSCNEVASLTIDGAGGKACGWHIIGKGSHLIRVGKDGYYPVQQNISVAPFSSQEIPVKLAVRTVKQDLELSSNNPVKLNEKFSFNYCDRFKNSLCITTVEGNQLDFNDAKALLLRMYSQDKSIPLILNRDLSTNNVLLYRSNSLELYITSPEEVNKPVVVVTNNSSTTHDQVLQAIKDTILGHAYDYYLMYQSPNLQSNNTLPNNIQLYWNNYGE